MSHHIYTTAGFIISSSPHGESGKYFLLFTKELGMIGATAQGVRLSHSKLRYYVQDYSFGIFSLVRGKEVWRMTGSKEAEDNLSPMNPSDRKIYIRILLLLKRLLPGEDKNEDLFEIIENLYRFLISDSNHQIELVEYTTVLRILNVLGYIHSKAPLDIFFKSKYIDSEILLEMQDKKELAVKEINYGLKESQL